MSASSLFFFKKKSPQSVPKQDTHTHTHLFEFVFCSFKKKNSKMNSFCSFLIHRFIFPDESKTQRWFRVRCPVHFHSSSTTSHSVISWNETAFVFYFLCRWHRFALPHNHPTLPHPDAVRNQILDEDRSVSLSLTIALPRPTPWVTSASCPTVTSPLEHHVTHLTQTPVLGFGVLSVAAPSPW